MPAATAPTAKFQILRHLASPQAPRAFSPKVLQEYLSTVEGTVSRNTLVLALAGLVEAQVIRPVRHGVYLNLRAAPQPQAEEALPLIRSGAVLSLQRVMAMAGAYNNPTKAITAVMPYTKRMMAEDPQDYGVTYQIFGMRPDFFPAAGTAEYADSYQRHARVRTATPERALVDWLFLSQKPSNGLPPPASHDVDFGALDHERLYRLADWMGMRGPVEALEQACARAEAAAEAAEAPRPSRPRLG